MAEKAATPKTKTTVCESCGDIHPGQCPFLSKTDYWITIAAFLFAAFVLTAALTLYVFKRIASIFSL